MSEFSESYHLKTYDKEKAIKLIESSQKRGYVLNESNGWVTFVIDGSSFSADESILFNNPGILVHYIHAEDHGWELAIFNKNETIFEYKCDWTDELTIEKEIFDLDIIKELVIEQGNSIDDIDNLFELNDASAVFKGVSPAYQFAIKIGLVNYEWVSIDYLDNREIRVDDGITIVNITN